jgi:hypothetical protein
LSFLEIRAERRQKSISVELSFAVVFAFKHQVSSAYVIVFFTIAWVNMGICFGGHITIPQGPNYWTYLHILKS